MAEILFRVAEAHSGGDDSFGCRVMSRGVSGSGVSVSGGVATRQKGSHLRPTTILHGEQHITIPDHESLRVETRVRMERLSQLIASDVRTTRG